MKNRVIIAGSRTCPETSRELFVRVNGILNHLDYDEIEIVSGTCRGADIFGENFADMMKLPIKRFPADWDKHGKAAGHMRNRQMAEYGTHLILIWDGKSKGSANMKKEAEKNNLKIREIIL